MVGGLKCFQTMMTLYIDMVPKTFGAFFCSGFLWSPQEMVRVWGGGEGGPGLGRKKK